MAYLYENGEHVSIDDEVKVRGFKSVLRVSAFLTVEDSRPAELVECIGETFSEGGKPMLYTVRVHSSLLEPV